MDRDDLAQERRLASWLATRDRQVTHPRAYAAAAGRRRVIDLHRCESRRAGRVASVDVGSFRAPELSLDDVIAVRQLLERLTPRQRTVLATWSTGATSAELAAQLGCSRSTAHAALQDALASARGLL